MTDFPSTKHQLQFHRYFNVSIVTTNAELDAYIIDGSKIAMPDFPEITEELFRVVIREELSNVGITDASRSTVHWTGHCRKPSGNNPTQKDDHRIRQ